MKNRHLYILAGALTCLGVGLFLYKAFILGFPIVPRAQTSVWNVEAQVRFEAKGEPVKVEMFVPQNTRRFTLLDEHFISRGYGLQTLRDGVNRQAIWTLRQAKGRQSLFYRAVVTQSPLDQQERSSAAPQAAPPGFEGAQLEAAQALLAEARAQSADLPSLLAGLLRRVNTPQPDGGLKLLLGKNLGQASRLGLAVRILRLAGLPARQVNGLVLDQPRQKAKLEYWLEVYHKDSWRCFDPVEGRERSPANLLRWWRGGEPLVKARGVERLHTTLSISHNMETALGAAVAGSKAEKPWLVRFSLFSLPVNSQQVYRLLLLVPLGAFVLIILRNVVGVVTFGTFMPVLIALAFRETRLLSGLVMFSILVGLGLSVRLYLERLKLLVVPRLAAVLIVVVLVMAALSVMLNLLGMPAGLSVALFPMVILTMTIERMSVVWDERGPAEAFKQGAGSLFAASLAYLVMNIGLLEHLVFVFPELILVLLAATLLMGRYAGYRLTELMRFKVLAQKDGGKAGGGA